MHCTTHKHHKSTNSLFYKTCILHQTISFNANTISQALWLKAYSMKQKQFLCMCNCSLFFCQNDFQLKSIWTDTDNLTEKKRKTKTENKPNQSPSPLLNLLTGPTVTKLSKRERRGNMPTFPSQVMPVLLFAICFTSQQHAGISQGQSYQCCLLDASRPSNMLVYLKDSHTSVVC